MLSDALLVATQVRASAGLDFSSGSDQVNWSKTSKRQAMRYQEHCKLQLKWRKQVAQNGPASSDQMSSKQNHNVGSHVNQILQCFVPDRTW